MPFFKEIDNDKIAKYKDLVQQYAQLHKLVPLYEMIDANKDSAYNECYICKLTIGDKFVYGVGRDKRQSERIAAKELVRKYNIQETNKYIGIIDKCSDDYISKQRKNDLDTVINILKIDQKYVNYYQIDEVLTYKSHNNKAIKQGYCSNGRIAAVGTFILSMLCSEYIFENYDITHVSLKKEISVLLNEENLSKVMPEECLKYLLKKPQNASDRNYSKMKINILQSTIAIVFINYISKRDQSIFEYIKKYSFSVFDTSSKDKILDYKSFLISIIQKYHWDIQILFERENTIDNNRIISSKIIITGDSWEIDEKGIGSTKK